MSRNEIDEMIRNALSDARIPASRIYIQDSPKELHVLVKGEIRKIPIVIYG